MTTPGAQARRPRLDGTTALVRNAVTALLPEEPAGLILAVSGGADSTALALAAAHLNRTTHHHFTAVTVDHGLQSGSHEHAQRVTAMCADLGLNSRCVTVHVEAGPQGREAAARSARYAALEAARVDAGAIAVLTGHTLDDQAETVLLGLARGSGARSLAGMRVKNGTVWRPLLDVTRDTTEAVCRAAGVEPWQDPWNEDPEFSRVRVRHTIMPLLEAELGPGVAAALARTAQLLAADSDELEAQASERADALGMRIGGDGSRTIPAQAAHLPTALRTRVLRDWLRETASGGQEITLGHIRAVDDLLTGRRAGAVSVPRSAQVTRSADGSLTVIPATGAAAPVATRASGPRS